MPTNEGIKFSGLPSLASPLGTAVVAVAQAGASYEVSLDVLMVSQGVIKADGTVPFSSNQSMGGFSLTSLAAPVDPTDAANKDFVLQAVAAVVPQTPNITALIQGGGVLWESDYNFRVSAAQYLIQGDFFSSIEQTVTLDAADPTLDRIDVIALNNTGTVVKITGTAAAQPSQPDIDPGTQLFLTFVFVGAATTAPPNVANEDIYLDNAEWTATTSGTGWNVNSTTNPHSGTKDIEGTSVANNAYVQLEAPAPLTLDSFALLSLFVQPKATWPKQRSLLFQWYSAGVAVGVPVTLNTGFFGFDSAGITSYQLVAIPVAQFAVPAGTSLNQLRITDKGGAIGMYIDDIVLQAFGSDIGGPPSGGITQDQADARYLQRANNLSDLTNAATATARLSVMVGDGGSGGTKGLVPAPASGDASKFLRGDATWGTPSGTGAPADATYITQTSNGGLSAEQALSALATGLLKNTTTTGVLSIAVAGTDYLVPGGALGTPSSGTLTNCTGLPLSGVTGFGTGVATALAVNVGSAGAPIVNGGALGTPSSGTLTSCTGLPLTTGVTGTLAATNGGTGQSTATKGDILASPGSNSWNKLSVGTDGQVLTADAASTNGVKWVTPSGGGGTNPTSTVVPYNNAGTFADSNIVRGGTDLTEVLRTTNAQTLNFYKSFVSATEYQRLKIDCSHASGIRLVADYQNATGINLLLGTAGSANSVLVGSGDMYPTASRGYNCGTSGNLWNQFNGYQFISNNASDTSGGGFSFSGGPDLYRTASGAMEIKDPTGAFNKIHLGLGQANVNVAFVKPASVQYIESRLGDESAFCYHVMAGCKFTSAQFDKTNATLADVTGLTSEALTAGKTYGFEAVLFVDADVTGGSKYAIAGTATATAIKYEIVLLADATNLITISSRQTALAGSAGQAGTTAGICRISGTITVNAAGTLTVQFAQNTANGTSSVLTMSNFRVWQIN